MSHHRKEQIKKRRTFFFVEKIFFFYLFGLITKIKFTFIGNSQSIHPVKLMMQTISLWQLEWQLSSLLLVRIGQHHYKSLYPNIFHKLVSDDWMHNLLLFLCLNMIVEQMVLTLSKNAIQLIESWNQFFLSLSLSIEPLLTGFCDFHTEYRL